MAIEYSGINYFPLLTGFFHSDKIELLTAMYGIKGPFAAVMLLCKTYTEGYYILMGKGTMHDLHQKARTRIQQRDGGWHRKNTFGERFFRQGKLREIRNTHFGRDTKGMDRSYKPEKEGLSHSSVSADRVRDR